MKNRKMYIIVIILIIVALAWLINRYFNSEAYFLTQLPEKYKHYPALNETIKSSHYQIQPLFTGSRAKTIYRDSVNNVLIIEKMEESRRGENQNSLLSFTYYRINPDGKVLDSLTEHSEQPYFGYEFNGHLLYENEYSNYLKTGHTKKYAYLQSNKNLQMGKNELIALLIDLRRKADAVKVDYSNNQKIYTISIANTVQQVFTPEPMQIEVEYKFQNNFHLLEPVTAYAGAKVYDWKSKQSPIYIDYFLKQEYRSASGPGIMSPAPMSRPANWLGLAYFTIALGRESIHFKHPIYFYPNTDRPSQASYGNESWGKLDYFSSPLLKFKLLTVGYNNDHVHAIDGVYLLLPRIQAK